MLHFAHGSSLRSRLAPIACALVFAGALGACDSSAVYLGSDVSDAGPKSQPMKGRDAGAKARDGGTSAKTSDAGGAHDAGRMGGAAGSSGSKPDASTPGDAGGGDMTTAGCDTGFADCNGDPNDGCEVNLQTDVKHCGACDGSCTMRGFDAFGGNCVAGLCTLTCEITMADCDGDPSNGCEAFLWFDAKNCGACGNVCANNCVQGSCQN